MNKKTLDKKVKAFTLLEVLIVLVVISILLLVGLPSLTKFTNSAKKRADDLNMMTIKEATALYLVEDADAQAKTGSFEVKTSELITKGYLDVKQLSKVSEGDKADALKSPLTNKAYTVTVNVPTGSGEAKPYIEVSNGETSKDTSTTGSGTQGK